MSLIKLSTKQKFVENVRDHKCAFDMIRREYTK